MPSLIYYDHYDGNEYKDYLKSIYGNNFSLGNYLKYNDRGKTIDEYLNNF